MEKENSVSLDTKKLSELLTMNLTIPDYQRIYCWKEQNVFRLLDDIKDIDKPYHLGSIILHEIKKGEYAIVDGQQRLVTLSLLILQILENADEIANADEISLLDQKFESEEAQSYIAYNKFLIKNYIEKNNKFNIENIKNNIQFSVLIICDASLDLAYTFFSNQNSRGKALSDYELLKAHHLRFIQSPEQAKHLAGRWDNIILESNDDLSRTLGTYLYRLRKWMRKREWNENEKYKIKTEFEAMSIISEIPPFGEQFYFYESIQGGAHFFAYADRFIYLFHKFKETTEFKALQELDGESHSWYRDVIESLLFAYFLKFGVLYLSEALVCIERVISEHRYNQSRANLKYVLIQGRDSEIVMMIDQATSPTFFLSEISKKINRLALVNAGDLNGIRKRYKNKIESIYSKVTPLLQINNIKEITK